MWAGAVPGNWDRKIQILISDMAKEEKLMVRHSLANHTRQTPSIILATPLFENVYDSEQEATLLAV
jgi:hypothetical protein